MDSNHAEELVSVIQKLHKKGDFSIKTRTKYLALSPYGRIRSINPLSFTPFTPSFYHISCDLHLTF